GNWSATRYGVYAGNTDWTGYPILAFDVRTDVAVAGSTVNFVVEDTAGNVSISPNEPVGTDWSTVTVDLASDLTFADGPGPSTDLTSLVRVGADFRSSDGANL